MAKSKTTTKTGTETETTTEERVYTKVELRKMEKLRKDILKARAARDTADMDLSNMLHKVHTERLWKQWDHDSFEDYCSNELEFAWRKAKYLVDIRNTMIDLDIEDDQVEDITWTKLREICTVMTKKNAKKLLKAAREKSVRDLNEIVKVMRRKDTSGADDLPEIVTMKFQMTSDDNSIVTDSLAACKGAAEDGKMTDTSALVMICQDWIEAAGKAPEHATIEQRIQYLEKTYGVDISFKPKKKSTKAEKKAEVDEAAAEVDEKAAKRAKAAAKNKKDKARGKATVNGKKKKPVDDDAGDVDALLDSSNEEDGEQDIDSLIGI